MRAAPWILASAWTAFCASTSAAPTTNPPGPAEFQFRLPAVVRFREDAATPAALAAGRSGWLKASPVNGSRNEVELGTRVVVGLKPDVEVATFLAQTSLPLARTVTERLFLFEAPDARTAATEADRLGRLPEVEISYPVLRRQFKKLGAYATKPDDPFFGEQFQLENRDVNGQPAGADLNARSAWAITRGEGTVIAVADDGIDLSHPEFVRRADNGLHLEFQTFTTNALPIDSGDNHGTAVAGLALAEIGNAAGIAGLAPAAQPASWKIFVGDRFVVSDEGMMDLYPYRSNVVSVEIHSWGNPSAQPMGPTPLESVGISNAVTFGRQGRGVVLVRAGGNSREDAGDANDDGWVNDPRSIGVAATGQKGRAASYSSPGACLLVAAPGGDIDRGVFTTDRQGADGYNGDLANNPDYAFDAGMMGTSFACPQVAGVAALLLSVNPNLGYRDVQQILILSSRHFDLEDPDLHPNGAGLLVSHNVGFGVPDAGEAVRLARGWPPRPPLTTLTFRAVEQPAIPDDGLRVLITGTDVPPGLVSIPSSPSRGPQPDTPTAVVPLVDVGQATEDLTVDLTGKAALIQRGVNTLADKIQRAARAGATFVVLFNDTGADERVEMPGTDFVSIPAVMIGQSAGVALKDYLQSAPDCRVRLRQDAAACTFTVPDTLICEQVSVRVRSDHSRRGDLRITLLSPQGTRSVLQHLNPDDFPGPVDWTYGSVHHFFESSAGTWKLEVTDEAPFDTGSILAADLIVRGVAITDTDHDGLEDGWELAAFGSLDRGPADDPDGDGYSNAREQVMGTNPRAVDAAFQLDLSSWDENLARLSWPGVSNRIYQILGGEDATSPLTVITAVTGHFPETEWFTAHTNLDRQFFRVQVPP